MASYKDFLDELLRSEANKKGHVETDVLDGKREPKFLTQIRRRARALDVDPQTLLNNSEQSSFPTPNCLLPDEVEEFRQGHKIATQRAAHVESCSDCQGMLAAAAPTPELLEQFLQEVKRSAENSRQRATAVRKAARAR